MVSNTFGVIRCNDQQGFIKTRSLHSNIQRLQQLYHGISSTNAEGVILQLDFQKAFDKVNHSYLEDRLRAIQLPPAIINIIMLITKQQQGSAFINNYIGPRFPIQRGLRQGDPLSALLFSLVMDSFNRTVDQSIDAYSTQPITIKMMLMAADVDGR
ncbi:unnamed protein product [Ambrosiozyma monospora]|uniref:Unnamed protein product n=1 Tax=Ambrosiozyma monospora TaxID=43982 RepID=A0ACB5U5X6_AMBMO|nr:unnamed protein product [Ambrosiozyma monospora]